MVLLGVTNKFNFCEAFLYDYIAAPAVLEEMQSFKATAFSALKKGQRIIDIGCGGGHLAADIAKLQDSISVHGVDLCLSQLKRAARRSMSAGTNVNLMQASALALPYPDESFDIVYSAFSIKHWTDRFAGLRECVRILKPGGSLFITELNRECPLEQSLRFVSNWRASGLLRPFFLISFYSFALLRSLSPEEVLCWTDRLSLKETTIEDGGGGVYWTIHAVKAHQC